MQHAASSTHDEAIVSSEFIHFRFSFPRVVVAAAAAVVVNISISISCVVCG